MFRFFILYSICKCIHPYTVAGPGLWEAAQCSDLAGFFCEAVPGESVLPERPPPIAGRMTLENRCGIIESNLVNLTIIGLKYFAVPFPMQRSSVRPARPSRAAGATWP